jgi:uncharacterized protein YjbI with pentapeptide repeats
VDRLALKIRDPKARADVEDNFRKTVGQALGGAAVLIGAGFALFQFLQQQYAAQEQQRTSQIQFREQQQATHDLLLSGADLSGANLSGADLSRADLSGVDLSGARELTQTQLDEACGDGNTKLPEGFTIKPCPRGDPPKVP